MDRGRGPRHRWDTVNTAATGGHRLPTQPSSLCHVDKASGLDIAFTADRERRKFAEVHRANLTAEPATKSLAATGTPRC
jgi:hypothetical protein